MLLDLREIIEIPGRELPFDCSVCVDDLLTPSVKEFKHDPHAVGRVFNEAGILTLEGTVTADMTCVCDRCGKEFDSVKVTNIKALITDGDSDDLSTLFLLDMETKFLCREDCKGLCSECGADLNLGPCNCRKQIDPRLAVLEQLLDK